MQVMLFGFRVRESIIAVYKWKILDIEYVDHVFKNKKVKGQASLTDKSNILYFVDKSSSFFLTKFLHKLLKASLFKDSCRSIKNKSLL